MTIKSGAPQQRQTSPKPRAKPGRRRDKPKSPYWLRTIRKIDWRAIDAEELGRTIILGGEAATPVLIALSDHRFSGKVLGIVVMVPVK